VRKSIPLAVEKFKKILKEECNKEMNVRLILNEKQFLDDIDKNRLDKIFI